MKKYLIVLLFVISLVFANVYSTTVVKSDSIDVEIVEDSYQAKTINVLVNGKIEQMDFEQYISHVVAAEMYLSYDMEALKAQAVTARTYAYNKLINGGCKNKGADMCDDINHCQAFKKEIPKEYEKKVQEAISSTKGQIITYEGKPIIALFHSTSGGMTEDNVNVFGSDLPYLKSVESSGEESSSRFRNTQVFKKQEVKQKLLNKYGKANSENIVVLERYDSGRVEKVDVFGIILTGKQLRELLGLSSANFDVSIEKDEIRFETIGYGHGVGLSQVGANYMAENGSGYQEIIKHYYTGVEIENISW